MAERRSNPPKYTYDREKMKSESTAFGKRVLELIEEHGLSVNGTRKRLGFTTQYFYNMLRKPDTNVPLEKIIELAEEISGSPVELLWLYFFQGEPTKEEVAIITHLVYIFGGLSPEDRLLLESMMKIMKQKYRTSSEVKRD